MGIKPLERIISGAGIVITILIVWAVVPAVIITLFPELYSGLLRNNLIWQPPISVSGGFAVFCLLVGIGVMTFVVQKIRERRHSSEARMSFWLVFAIALALWSALFYAALAIFFLSTQIILFAFLTSVGVAATIAGALAILLGVITAAIITRR